MAALEEVAFAAKMHEFIEEVVPYLQIEQRKDVREQGLAVLLSQTDELIGINDDDLITMVKAVETCLEEPSMLTSALTLLVNVSAECGQIFREYDMEVIFTQCYRALKKSSSVELILMFLTNVTTIEEKARAMLWLQHDGDKEKKEGEGCNGDEASSTSSSSSSSSLPASSFATFVIAKCLEYNPQIEPDHLHGCLINWDEVDPWQYSSSVLCNLR